MNVNLENNKVNSMEKSKDVAYNVSETAIETLLENVLTGKTVVLPTEVFRTVSAKKNNSSISLALGSKPQISKGNNITNENDLDSWVNVNNTKDSVFIHKEALVERVENCNEENQEDDDGTTTRAVTPVDFRSSKPVSEQFIQAKRILNTNPYGIEPPDFQNLPTNMEEFFTLTSAYVAQLVVSATAQLNCKLDQVLKKFPDPENIPDVTRVGENSGPTGGSNCASANQLSKGIPSQVSQNETKSDENSKEDKSDKAVVPESTNSTKQLQNTGLENQPPKTPADPFLNFENYLERIKMPPPEITAHLNYVRILSNKEANKYMAKFGFTAKKKKK